MTQSHKVSASRNRGAHIKVRVLTELEGLPWDDPVVRAVVSAVRPEWIRVQEPNRRIHSDSRPWRVTVYLDGERRVSRIEQEVTIWFQADVPMTVACGWDVEKHLRKLRDELPGGPVTSEDLQQLAGVPDLRDVVESVMTEPRAQKLIQLTGADESTVRVFVHEVMERAEGKLNPALVREAVIAKISGGSS